MSKKCFLTLGKLLKQLTSEDYVRSVRKAIEDCETYSDPQHYGTNVTIKDDYGTAHVSVLAPDGSAVSVTSTINQM